MKRKGSKSTSATTKSRRKKIPRPRLPCYLVVDPKDGYSFVSRRGKPYQVIQSLLGDNCFEGVPVNKTYFGKEKIEIFMDEVGMMKMLPMNQWGNPFVEQNWLVNMARFGGPFGRMIVYAPRGHSRELFEKFPNKAVCEMLDLEEEEAEQYTQKMKTALNILFQ